MLLTIVGVLVAYTAASNFVEVHSDAEYNQLIRDSKDKWLVTLGAPFCGACKNAKPELEKAAATLEGDVKFAYINYKEAPELSYALGVKKIPFTYYLSADDK